MAFNDAFAYGLLLTCNETSSKLEVLEGSDINGCTLCFLYRCVVKRLMFYGQFMYRCENKDAVS